MGKLILTLVLGLVILVAMSNKFPAYGQDLPNDKMFIVTQFCGPFKEVMETPKKYREGMLFSGNGVQMSTQNGRMFQGGMFFFVNQETGSYSIINVYADGMACMMQTGKDFEPYTGVQPWDKEEGGL